MPQAAPEQKSPRQDAAAAAKTAVPERAAAEPAKEPEGETRPARRFADLDDFESEIKIPDFLTRKKF